MATVWNNQKKVALFVFIILCSVFFSIQLFAGLSSLLGAVLLGLIVTKRWLNFVFVLLLYLAVITYARLLGAAAFYPIVFVLVTYLFFVMFDKIGKGTLFLLVTLILSLLFIVVMVFLEVKTGFVSETIKGAKKEIMDMANVLKDIMTEKELSEFTNFALQLLEKYYIFFALLQIVLFTALNFLLLPYLFDGLTETLAQPFYRLSIPYYGVWGINIGLILYLFQKGTVAVYGINIVLFFLAIYFFQGLSLSAAFFRKYGVPFYVATIFFAMFLINQFMWLFVSIAGIVDAQFNIKKYLKEA